MKFFNLRFPNNPRGKRALIGAGFLLIAALMSASIFATGPKAEPEAIDEKAWPVSVTIATSSAWALGASIDAPRSSRSVCTISPVAEASASTQATSP